MGANGGNFHLPEVYQLIFNIVKHVKIFITCWSLLKKPYMIHKTGTILPATNQGTSSYTNEPVIKEWQYTPDEEKS